MAPPRFIILLGMLLSVSLLQVVAQDSDGPAPPPPSASRPASQSGPAPATPRPEARFRAGPPSPVRSRLLGQRRPDPTRPVPESERRGPARPEGGPAASASSPRMEDQRRQFRDQDEEASMLPRQPDSDPSVSRIPERQRDQGPTTRRPDHDAWSEGYPEEQMPIQGSGYDRDYERRPPPCDNNDRDPYRYDDRRPPRPDMDDRYDRPPPPRRPVDDYDDRHMRMPEYYADWYSMGGYFGIAVPLMRMPRLCPCEEPPRPRPRPCAEPSKPRPMPRPQPRPMDFLPTICTVFNKTSQTAVYNRSCPMDHVCQQSNLTGCTNISVSVCVHKVCMAGMSMNHTYMCMNFTTKATEMELKRRDDTDNQKVAWMQARRESKGIVARLRCLTRTDNEMDEKMGERDPRERPTADRSLKEKEQKQKEQWDGEDPSMSDVAMDDENPMSDEAMEKSSRK